MSDPRKTFIFANPTHLERVSVWHIGQKTQFPMRSRFNAAANHFDKWSPLDHFISNDSPHGTAIGDVGTSFYGGASNIKWTNLIRMVMSCHIFYVLRLREWFGSWKITFFKKIKSGVQNETDVLWTWATVITVTITMTMSGSTNLSFRWPLGCNVLFYTKIEYMFWDSMRVHAGDQV